MHPIFVHPHSIDHIRIAYSIPAQPEQKAPQSQTMLLLAAASIAAGGYSLGSSTMWEVLDAPPSQAFSTLFGPHGDRGEYMDGYSKAAMIQRCHEDYQWTTTPDTFLQERAEMMSHLYDHNELWEYVSMVAFADHYVLDVDNDSDDNSDENSDAPKPITKPYETFCRHKALQPHDRPIFAGVVFRDWEQQQQQQQQDGMAERLQAFQQIGIDYVRLECNLGTDQEIGGPDQLLLSPEQQPQQVVHKRLERLAKAAKECQNHELVPLVLLQFPWRDPDISQAYFERAVQAFGQALELQSVDASKFLFETRPPVGMSAQQERQLTRTERQSLGLAIGQKMFEVMHETFSSPIAGFCVAGGSTKGDHPTAMEDDTQNAVRQGIRTCAKQMWNSSELCFWEMGAKLLLQPKVGLLWKNRQNQEARDLFCANAQHLAEEIRAGL